MRNKPKADPLFYSGIVLIAIMTPVLIRYFVVRVSHAGANRRLSNPLGPDDDQEWISLMPGGGAGIFATRPGPVASTPREAVASTPREAVASTPREAAASTPREVVASTPRGLLLDAAGPSR